MKLFVIADLLLNALIPAFIILHLLVAPYSKVEESFNLQATHDILTYGTPSLDISARLRSNYDHFDFPGAVPRSFVGAAVLALTSQPILSIVGQQHSQLVVRTVLGLFNAFALLRFGTGVDKAFGKGAGRWYRILQASQFHVIYYASRTLPNMFAFGLSTLALREFLPMPIRPSSGGNSIMKRHSTAIYLLVFSGVIFRSEIAIMVATQVFFLLLQPAITLQTVFRVGIRSFLMALAISIPMDSYFWQRPIWPELSGFIYNAIHGNSTNWGTSPIHAYFTSFLPKLLLNPLIPTLLLPLSFYLPATRRSATGLTIPSLVFVAIYSLQPHKEARFIIYVVPPLTAAAALSASYLFTRRRKSALYALLSTTLVFSVFASILASLLFLAISSLNYPGGEALWQLHRLAASDATSPRNVSVHMDILSCMTGVSRFQQEYPTRPFSSYLFASPSSSTVDDRTLTYRYSKEEDKDTLLTPNFWQQFDYVLAEAPEKVMGKWEIVYTVYGYAGMELLKPGLWPRPDCGSTEGVAAAGLADGKGTPGDLGRYAELREWIRERFTRGWWVGPRMEGKTRILRRIE